MESKRLEKNIREWAIGLGFRLPDGSLPPLNYFASLTATPNRRLLWEKLVESVHPRDKADQMKKQILVSMLKEKTSTKPGKIELWERQKSLEAQIKEKSAEVSKLEKSIMMRASDLLFEICKLAELEKQCEEYKEKVLVLKLFTRREKKLLEGLEEMLLRVMGVSTRGEFLEKCFLNVEGCRNPAECGDCEVSCKLSELSKSGLSEECLWGEVIKCKRIILEKFSEFIKELNINEKSVLSEEEKRIQKSLNLAVTHLKQRITEKSLEVIINETQGKLLRAEMERLQERVEEEMERNPWEEVHMNISSGKEQMMTKIRNYVKNAGLKSYQEELKEELIKLKENQREKVEMKDRKEEFQKTLNSFDSLVQEINLTKSEEEELARQIVNHHGRFQTLLASAGEDVREEGHKRAVEESVGKLKAGSERQVDLFVEMPLDAFRTVDAPSGRKVFERESLAHCLSNYGGEMKQFFRGALVPPGKDVDSILGELQRRKECVESLGRFAEQKGRLSDAQRKLLVQVASIKRESPFYADNLKQCDEILWSVSIKAENVARSILAVEKILNSWVKQPFRLMIPETETVHGKTLREHEEKYKERRVD